MRTPLLLALLVAACGDHKTPAASADAAPAHVPKGAGSAEDEARVLGKELFGVMDRVMAYRASHFNNLPQNLPGAGIDSLTRTTIRRLSASGGVPTVTVVFRQREGRALQGCSGTSKVIEDSMLNGGAYEVQCTLISGESQAFTVGG